MNAIAAGWVAIIIDQGGLHHNTMARAVESEYLKTLRLRQRRAPFHKGVTLAIKRAIPPLVRKAGLTYQVNAATFFGQKMKVVLPDIVSTSIWRFGYFELDVCFYLLKLLRPNDTFIDIGGHFGFFSMLAREIVGSEGTVVTFEPMPDTREILKENMERYASRARGYIIPAAAGATRGRISFKDFGLSGSAFATSTLERSSYLKYRGDVDVEVRTLDDVAEELGLADCHLVKIDAENSEYDVLRGSVRTIRRSRPALILETGDSIVGDGASRRVIDLLLNENYRAFEFSSWAIRVHTVTDHYAYQNLLMIPAERVREVMETG